MTKEDAISLLKQVNEILINSNSWLENTHEPLNQAFDMAIKALEQQPSGDCVDRAELLKQIKEWRDCEFVRMTNPYHYLEKRIQSLPPVTSTQGTCKECKEWINDKKYPRCRNFGFALNEDFYCADFERRE